jgi:hypothetical protein
MATRYPKMPTYGNAIGTVPSVRTTLPGMTLGLEVQMKPPMSMFPQIQVLDEGMLVDKRCGKPASGASTPSPAKKRRTRSLMTDAIVASSNLLKGIGSDTLTITFENGNGVRIGLKKGSIRGTTIRGQGSDESIAIQSSDLGSTVSCVLGLWSLSKVSASAGGSSPLELVFHRSDGMELVVSLDSGAIRGFKLEKA